MCAFPFSLASRPSTPRAAEARATDHLGLALAIGSAALFSLKGVIVKLGLGDGHSVETLIAWRMGLALPVYVVIGALAFARPPASDAAPTRRRDLAAAALLGVTSYHLCTWLDFTGLQFVSVQLERMLLFTYPAITAVLAGALLGERFTRRQAAGLALAYAGVACVFAFELTEVGPDVVRGAGLVFAAAVFFAAYLVAAKPVLQRLGSVRFTCVAMTTAACTVLLHQAWVPVDAGVAGVAAASTWHRAAAYGAALAGVCTVLPSFMLSAAVKRLGPARSSAAGNVGPAVTVAAGVLVLGDPFGVWHAGGLVLILVGVRLSVAK